MEEDYSKREIDTFMQGIHETLGRIESQTTATNGKVKKIIIALVLISGFVLGSLGKDLAPILIKLFA